MRFSGSVILLLALFSYGCKTPQETVSTETKQEEPVYEQINLKPVLLASIERTACYGRCPMYKITYMDNGQVIYIGRRFVEKVGTYTTLLNEEEINSIKEMAEDFGYFDLDSLYPTSISDFPSCITEVSFNGKRKRVIDRHDPPRSLKTFEKFLDSLVEEKKFRKESDNTDYRQQQK